MSSLRARRTARNPFAFPRGNPGFNPGHIAAGGMSSGRGISAVAMGGGFVNLLNGKIGSNANSPTATVDGSIGSAVNYSATNMSSSFAGQSTANDTTLTIAAIFRLNSLSGLQIIFSNTATGSTGIALSASGIVGAGDGKPQFNAFGGANTSQSGVVLSANVPYFLVVSRRSSDNLSNFLALNLSTGVISTSTSSTALSPAAPDGTYIVANRSTAVAGLVGKLSAVMFAPSFISMNAMSSFASDPWSFWYPQT